MALIHNPQGCKVGWAFYDNEAEATARAQAENAARDREFAQGYDFGYQWPGAMTHIENHPDFGECWMVVTV